MNLRNSIIRVSILNIFSTLMLFISSVMLARYFGAGREVDIYFTAIAIPYFFSSLFSSVLGYTFIPLFSKGNLSKQTWVSASIFLNVTVPLLLVISFCIFLFPSHIIKMLAPGFDNASQKIAIKILKSLSPIILISFVNEIFSSLLYAHQKFLIPAITKALTPIMVIIFIFMLSNEYGIMSLVYATISGGILHFILLMFTVKKYIRFKYHFSFDYKDSLYQGIISFMGPLIFISLMMKVLPLYDRYTASYLVQGTVSYLAYSFKIYSQLPSLISVGLSLVVFSTLADLANGSNYNLLKDRLSKAVRMLLYIAIPMTSVMVLFSSPLIELVYEGGAFSSEATLQTSRALMVYSLALPFAVSGDVINKVYYILQDSKTPAILGIVEIIIYISIVSLFVDRIGHLSIPVAYLSIYLFSSIHFLIIRYKLGNSGGKAILKYSIYVALLSGCITYTVKEVFNIYGNSNVSMLYILMSLILFHIICSLIFKVKEGLVINETFKSLVFSKAKSS